MTLPRCRPRFRLPASTAVVMLATSLVCGLAPLAGPPAAIAAPAGQSTSPLWPSPSVLPTIPNAEYFNTPRDLSGCPYATTPPPAVDESEVVSSGSTTPSALPVPDTPVGGEELQGCEVIAPRGFTVPTEVTASSWIVVDLDSGDVVAARDPHGRYRPASIIKTLLALVVLDELDLDDIITVKAAHLKGAEGSAVGVGPGGMYSIDRLLHGLLMMSGNDAALALAHELGGVDEALEKMNDYAQRLGCTDTRAASVNGLDKAGMSTSAYDMALIFREALDEPDFVRIIGTTTWGFPGYPAHPAAGPPNPRRPPQTLPQPTTARNGTVVHPGFIISNDNKLLYNYPGALGGKTGFTDDARHTFIGAAERRGRRLAAVLLDTTRYPTPTWKQAALLLDSGFAAKESPPVGALVSESVDTVSGSSSLDRNADSDQPLQALSPTESSTTTTDLPASWVWIGALSAIALALFVVWRVRQRRE